MYTPFVLYFNICSLLNIKECDSPSLLLPTIRPDALIVYNSFQFTSMKSNDDLDMVIAKLEQHFIEQTNQMYEWYVFNKIDQKQGENLDSYVTMLCKLVKSCNFC